MAGNKDLSECWNIIGEKKNLEKYSCGLASLESIPPALVVFEESRAFDEALERAICLGGDTDSIGAIVGAFAGAYYGIPKKFGRYFQKENKIVTTILKYVPES